MNGTASISLPGSPPVTLSLPAAKLTPAPVVIVSGKRAWMRNASTGAYAEEANFYFDPTGDAEAADTADLHAAIADLKAERTELVAVVSDAHATIDKLVSNAKAIPADIEKDADGMLARLEKWVKAHV